MGVDQILIENKWTEKDLFKFILKYYWGKLSLVVYSLYLLFMGLFIFLNVFVMHNFDGDTIMYIATFISFPIIIYVISRMSVNRIVKKCNTLTISNVEILVDSIKLYSIDKIIISGQFLLISSLKSYFVINLQKEDADIVKELIENNNIGLINHPKRFSYLKLYYSDKF